MEKVPLTNEELNKIKPGEAITLATVMAILAIAIVSVIVYKLFITGDGKVKLPGGYQFEWKWQFKLKI